MQRRTDHDGDVLNRNQYLADCRGFYPAPRCSCSVIMGRRKLVLSDRVSFHSTPLFSARPMGFLSQIILAHRYRDSLKSMICRTNPIDLLSCAVFVWRSLMMLTALGSFLERLVSGPGSLSDMTLASAVDPLRPQPIPPVLPPTPEPTSFRESTTTQKLAKSLFFQGELNSS